VREAGNPQLKVLPSWITSCFLNLTTEAPCRTFALVRHVAEGSSGLTDALSTLHLLCHPFMLLLTLVPPPTPLGCPPAAGPRCQSDAVLLPNGKVIIINGGEVRARGGGGISIGLGSCISKYCSTVGQQ
jgi:hypothetical protein